MWEWGDTFWDEGGDANDEAGTAHGGAMLTSQEIGKSFVSGDR